MASKVDARRGRRALDTAVIVSAVIGIALGIVALVWPDRTLVAIAAFVGYALIVAGLLRIIAAVVSGSLELRERIGLVVLGLISLILGIILVAFPTRSLVVVAVVLGIGWIVGGIRDLIFGWRSSGGVRTLAVIAGGLQVAGGIAMVVLPGIGLATFVVVAAILLILVSAATLLTLPARSTAGPR